MGLTLIRLVIDLIAIIQHGIAVDNELVGPDLLDTDVFKCRALEAISDRILAQLVGTTVNRGINALLIDVLALAVIIVVIADKATIERRRDDRPPERLAIGLPTSLAETLTEPATG